MRRTGRERPDSGIRKTGFRILARLRLVLPQTPAPLANCDLPSPINPHTFRTRIKPLRSRGSVTISTVYRPAVTNASQ
jgi:hypothetical protein